MDDEYELPFLSNVGLMMTYKCSVSCPHCIVEAGPLRTEEMQAEQALNWIDQVRAYRGGLIQAVCLTGGEPFCNMELLTRLSEHARAVGLVVSVVTNGYWATSPEAALRTLERVPAIQAITISTDVYHQQAIPFSRVRNAVEAARVLKRVYTISACTSDEEDPAHLGVLDQLESIGERKNTRVAVTLPVGRALQQLNCAGYAFSPDPPVTACPVASSPVIFPNGNVIACIGPLLTLPAGHPLYLGNLNRETLAEILDRAELNPILHAIRVWGPHKLVSLLKAKGYGGLLPRRYISNAGCDACFKLLSNPAITSALQEVFSDEDLVRAIAYGRVYFLKETAMVEQLHLDTLAE